MVALLIVTIVCAVQEMRIRSSLSGPEGFASEGLYAWKRYWRQLEGVKLNRESLVKCLKRTLGGGPGGSKFASEDSPLPWLDQIRT